MDNKILLFEEFYDESNPEQYISSRTWYHGSKRSDFKWGIPKSGKDRKSDMQLDFGTHFTQDEEYAAMYGTVHKVKLVPSKTLDLIKGSSWSDDNDFEDRLALYRKMKPPNSFDKHMLSYYDKNGNKQDTIQLVGLTQNILDSIPPSRVYNSLIESGYDSVLYEPYHPSGVINGIGYIDKKGAAVIALTKYIIKPIG